MGVAIRAVLFEKCPKCIHVQSTKSWSDGYGTGVEFKYVELCPFSTTQQTPARGQSLFQIDLLLNMIDLIAKDLVDEEQCSL